MAYVGTLQVLKAFDPGKWSICIFFEDVAPEGDDVKKPPPSGSMQTDSSLPSPDPGSGPSQTPGPPPLPDEPDDIADDESLDPGDEFGDPDLPFLPPTGKCPSDEADKGIYGERQPSRRPRGREPPPERERCPHRSDREFHWDP